MCNGVWRCGGCGEIVEGDFTEHAIECVKKEQDLEEEEVDDEWYNY